MRSFIDCIKCKKTKPREMFYKSSIRRSGLVGECSICIRARVKAANNKPHRLAYFNSQAYRDKHKDDFRKYRSKYPDRCKVRMKLYTAVEQGLLVRPDNCELCGSSSKIEAHHDDYNKELDVRWLCIPCHKDWHTKNTPIYKNA